MQSRTSAPGTAGGAPGAAGPSDRIGDRLARSGVSRRRFVSLCGHLMAAAPFMCAITEKLTAQEVADDLARAERPSVIWLHFQDCTGCTESLLRAAEPDLASLITDVISLDYHETLMAASGHQAEAALREAMARHRGRYVLVVEGSIPTKDQGVYMQLAGRNAVDVLAECAADAGAIIAMGSCAAFGGLPAVGPDPTGARGVEDLVTGKPLVNIPGCPPNPYTLLAVVLQYARHGTLPALDAERRPRFAYDRVIHEHCPRRAHFDAGRFVEQFGDEGSQLGWCLYKVGCKGPETHAPCSVRHFNDVVDAWPIGIGAPCVGCTEKSLAFRVPMFDTIPIKRATPPDTYPTTLMPEGRVSPLATGLVGGALGAGLVAAAGIARKLGAAPDDGGVPPTPAPDAGDAPRAEAEAIAGTHGETADDALVGAGGGRA